MSRVQVVAFIAIAVLASACGGARAEEAQETTSATTTEPATTASTASVSGSTTEAASASEPVARLLPHGSKRAGFRIGIPADWDVLTGRRLKQVGIGPPFLVFSLSPTLLERLPQGKMGASLSVASAPVPSGATFDDYVNGSERRFRAANPRARKFRQRIVRLPAGRALEYTYEARSRLGPRAATRQYGLIANGREWVLVFETGTDVFAEDVKLFERIAKSFRVTR